MNQIQDDESIQSFILRILIVHGESDFSGVLNPQGKWLVYPHVQATRAFLFAHYDKNELLSVLQRSGIGIPMASLFSSPVAHFDAISKVFEQGERYYSGNNHNDTVDVLYCEDCIKQDLKSLGFGYFRATWLRRRCCEHHDKVLHTIRPNSRKANIDVIREVLRGGDLRTGNQIQTKINNDIHEHTLRPIDPNEKFAPCLQKKLLHWTRKNSCRFDKKTGSAKSITPLLIATNGKYIDLTPDEFSSICEDLKSDHPKQFNDLIKNDAETIEIRVVVCDHLFQANLKKAKGKNCTKCDLYIEGFECANAKHVPIYQQQDNTSNSLSNPCDYYLTNKRHYWNDFSIAESTEINEDVWDALS